MAYEEDPVIHFFGFSVGPVVVVGAGDDGARIARRRVRHFFWHGVKFTESSGDPSRDSIDCSGRFSI
jgi:hypothetical protein